MSIAPPHVFFIPAGQSFVDLLARGLLDEAQGDALADTVILLPTRRACRALREAFLRQADGAPLLLPAMRPLGDDEEDDFVFTSLADLDLPPAVAGVRRMLLLARAVQALGDKRGGQTPSPEQAVRLAGELAGLLDQVQTEGLSFDRLARLVPEDFAAHWQVTLEFLKILTELWPSVLAEQGLLDPAERRNRLLTWQAERWEAEPPRHPVIAAGSTGSIPATARLLAVIARLPLGRLVLPGLDPTLAAAERAALDHTHPQFGLTRLLDGLAVAPEQVRRWPGGVDSRRAWLAGEIMRPAATTDGWRHLAGRDVGAAMSGLSRLEAPNVRDEALAIALVLRQALETPGRTAALVTPDRGLARRVAAELDRFDIEIDDSAGRDLTLTPPGAFLALTAAMVAEDFAPHPTLAALKHPLASFGSPPGAFRAVVRRLEVAAWRGPRPAPGIDGLLAALADSPDLASWVARLGDQAAPLVAAMARPAAPLAEFVAAHRALAEALAGPEALWRGDAGAAAGDFLDELIQAADALPPLAGRFYPGLLRVLMAQVAVRPAFGRHPRLAIWGPLEARLQSVDVLVVGGLNEGVWPPEPAIDPWMNRPMRAAFGLPPPERRVGLSAHDFVSAFAAPEVVLTRALRAEGTPTRPSRWLLRLDAVLAACGAAAPWPAAPWLGWAEVVDRPAALQPSGPPSPCPPLAARPRQLSVTAIETWMRDPYAIYAGKILNLAALPAIDADPGAADYGSLIHAALSIFLKRHPTGAPPPDALSGLLAIGRQGFAELAVRPGLMAFWWPRFERVAAWFIDNETARRRGLAGSFSEIAGRLEFAMPAGPFVLTARADRIDRLAAGGLALIDYKTGAPPSAREVAAGFAPQLPLEAAIAQAGGFDGVPAAPVRELAFWHLHGGAGGGGERPAGKDPAALAAAALDGVRGLIAAFDDPTTPYQARPHPERAPRYSDFLHLARVKGWSTAEEDDG
jgi:ATP-dependent helicase/nuclease subunit B